MTSSSSQVDTAGGAGQLTVPAHSDSQFFLQLATIPGPVTAAAFAGQIQLLSWGWGVDSPGTVLGAAGAGAGVGKPVPQDVLLLARTDIHSPKILTVVNTGRHLQTALLSCVKPGPHPLTYLTLKLDDVLVTGYHVAPDPTDGLPVDLVRLKFAKVTQRFFTQKPDGSLAPPVESSFDYKTNTAGP